MKNFSRKKFQEKNRGRARRRKPLKVTAPCGEGMTYDGATPPKSSTRPVISCTDTKREAHVLADESGLVFPTGKPLSDMTLWKLLKALKIPAVPHGFRSSFSVDGVFEPDKRPSSTELLTG